MKLELNLNNLIPERVRTIENIQGLKARALEAVFSDYPSAVSGSALRASADFDSFMSQSSCDGFKPTEDFLTMSNNQLRYILNQFYMIQVYAVAETA